MADGSQGSRIDPCVKGSSWRRWGALDRHCGASPRLCDQHAVAPSRTIEASGSACAPWLVECPGHGVCAVLVGDMACSPAHLFGERRASLLPRSGRAPGDCAGRRWAVVERFLSRQISKVKTACRLPTTDVPGALDVWAGCVEVATVGRCEGVGPMSRRTLANLNGVSCSQCSRRFRICSHYQRERKI